MSAVFPILVFFPGSFCSWVRVSLFLGMMICSLYFWIGFGRHSRISLLTLRCSFITSDNSARILFCSVVSNSRSWDDLIADSGGHPRAAVSLKIHCDVSRDYWYCQFLSWRLWPDDTFHRTHGCHYTGQRDQSHHHRFSRTFIYELWHIEKHWILSDFNFSSSE